LRDVAAGKLVWIGVADQLAERGEMFAARVRLIVFFDEGNRQSIGSKRKALIIESELSERNH